MNALLTNPFKERLRKGEVQIGLWLSSTTAYMAEIQRLPIWQKLPPLPVMTGC